MAKSALLGILGIAVVCGGAAAYLLTDGGGSGLDRAGKALLARFAAEQASEATGKADEEELRGLLKDILAHPDAGMDRRLLRAQAWIYQRLGNSLRAYEAIHGNLGVDVEPADLELGARILMARHAETGDRDQADQALSCARLHYDATGEVASLFRAWQMAVRLEDPSRRKDLQEQLGEHAETPYGKVVAALPKFPDEVDQAADARRRFLSLMDEFDTPPEELTLALAWWEVGQADHRLAGKQRAEEVLRTFRVSRTARVLIATAAILLEEPRIAKAHLEWLLKTHPQHPDKQKWQGLLRAAEAVQK